MTRRAFIKMTVMTLLLAPAFPLSAEELLSGDHPTEDTPLGKENPRIYPATDDRLKDYLYKVRNPDAHHPDDIVLDEAGQQLLGAVVDKLARLYLNVGSGNFSTLGFDEALLIARRQPSVGSFTNAELAFLEMIYSRDAGDYGFFGTKQAVALLHVIAAGEIVKVPQTGNSLFKGESLEKYTRIKNNLGDDVILTSGIRGIVKQFYLFLGKAWRHGGNLSLASRSLAPPGYSYHATGDFDIGQKGLGLGNFSELFTTTPVYKRLAEQGLVDYRYWQDNMLGVRYEPWHVKL
ncbi:MAG: M15 family metallopeptidase [Proteobacteria bacterium]|nr:M15 family metallopeptidase [Pseudomonadota bacterium]